MKKLTKLLFASMCAASLMFTFAACGNGTTDTPVDPGDDPDDPGDTPEPAVTYTVDFDTDGGSAVPSQTVEEGDYATRPEDPVKDGVLFGNWYAEQTLETPFEFETTQITKDTTIYASWISADSALTATFYWNYDGAPDGGVFYTANFEEGERIGAISSPERDGYVFGGWYTEDGEEFSPARKYDSSMEFYAQWQASYTFEAEYTQVTGLTEDYPDYADENGNKLGYNFSGSANGANLIKSDASASNGQYISGLYYRGGYIEFVITSDAAVENAQLRLVLGCEYADITLTAATYRVSVNGTNIAYTTQIKLGNGAEVSSQPGLRGSWQEVNIGEISLKEGENIIRLTVNNNQTPAGEAGTVDAASPMVDCIKIITNANLTMTEYNK